MEEKVLQLKEEYKQKLNRLNDYLWGAGLKDPVSRIQQMSFLFFLKMLEEQDTALEKEEKLTRRPYKSIFKGKSEKYRWSNWVHKSGSQGGCEEEYHNQHVSIGIHRNRYASAAFRRDPGHDP